MGAPPSGWTVMTRRPRCHTGLSWKLAPSSAASGLLRATHGVEVGGERSIDQSAVQPVVAQAQDAVRHLATHAQQGQDPDGELGIAEQAGELGTDVRVGVAAQQAQDERA